MKSPARRLLAFLALVALGPLLLRPTERKPTIREEIPERIPPGFEDSSGADLEHTPAFLARVKPEVVFVGNSMLNTRIDEQAFHAESGFHCERVSRSSTASALWYLYLKNIIAPLEVKPKVVIVFFRDYTLTAPAYRTTGIYRPYFESLQRSPEPVLDQVLWNPDSAAPVGARARFAHTVRAFYGITNQPAFAHGKLTDLAFDLTRFGTGKAIRRNQMSVRFGLENLRHDLGDDLGTDNMWDNGGDTPAFSASPNASFLPHMLDLAREHGFTLCFYRVKRRCDVDGTRDDDPKLAPYLEDLDQFIHAKGGLFIDESEDPIPPEWYSDGDHIGTARRPDYTRRFWKKTRPFLEPLLSGEPP